MVTQTSGEPGEMGREPMQMSPEMPEMMAYDSSDLFNQINRIAYPMTIALTLFVAIVSFRLIKLTHQIDKFSMVALGMAFLFAQAIIGSLFYISEADIVTMRTVMFYSGLLTTLAMLFIGTGFYRWMRMLK